MLFVDYQYSKLKGTKSSTIVGTFAYYVPTQVPITLLNVMIPFYRCFITVFILDGKMDLVLFRLLVFNFFIKFMDNCKADGTKSNLPVNAYDGLQLRIEAITPISDVCHHAILQ